MAVSAEQPAATRVSARSHRPGAATLEFAVVTLAVLLVVRGVSPAKVFTNALPFGGDQAGHAVIPWVTRHQLLSHGSVSGWSDAWFAGFPVNQLYPALPNIVIALLSFVLPLAVALKLVSVSGLILMPLAAWAAARWAGLPRPYPAVLAVFTIPSIFDTSCVTCGGNVASVMGGEYSFQLGLTVAVLGLGAFDRLLRTGERRARTAAILAVALLCHPVTSLWLVAGCLLLLAFRHPWTRDRQSALATLATVGVVALLAAPWWLPFLARRSWMTSPAFPKRTDLVFWLLPGSLAWSLLITLVAVAGFGLAVFRRRPLLITVGGLTALSVLLFMALPTGQLFNLRVLPFYVLGRWLLVGGALTEVWLTLAASPRRLPTFTRVSWPLPVAAVVIVALWNAATFGWVPGTVTRSPTMGSNGRASVFGLPVTVTRLAAWPRTVLAGYEARPDYPELASVIAMLQTQTAEHGCGRLAWDHVAGEYDPAHSPFGDDNVFWRAPLWTGGCLTTMTGSLLDSSATTSGILLAESPSSTLAAQWKAGLPYQGYDLGHGADRLSQLGVRYYLTHGGTPARDAPLHADFTKLASTGRWTLWELPASTVVQPLRFLPTVAPGVSTATWESLEAAYADSPIAGDSPLVADGPSDWPRVSVDGIPTPTPVTPAVVTAVHTTGSRISFHVDRPGVPVLVKVSDYPGWRVTGAASLLRATPNFLVVVPTGLDVVISRAHTALGIFSGILGLLGILALVAVAVFERRGALSPTPAVDATPAYRPPPVKRR